MSDTRTEAVTALLEGVTPGPWRMGQDEEGPPATCITAGGFDICTAWGGYLAEDADAAFIAAARQLVPALLAQRDAAIARANAAEAKVEKLRATLSPFSEMAGELFARNYNQDDTVLMFINADKGAVRLVFGDFLVARAALTPPADLAEGGGK